MDLKGNNEILTLTQPHIIRDIHASYLMLSADIIETNTFTANGISQADYGTENLVFDLNFEAARLAQSAVQEAMQADRSRTCYVAGALGPTTRSASISPDVNDPGFRNVSFDDLVDDYTLAIDGLVKGKRCSTHRNHLRCVERKGRNLRGAELLRESRPEHSHHDFWHHHRRKWSPAYLVKTVGAFWSAVRHASPMSIGFNCALGAAELHSYTQEISRLADCYVSAYPNRGLPNEFGEYDETIEEMSEAIAAYLDEGMVNLIGGCCGTTPDHIAAFADLVKSYPPRKAPERKVGMSLSGLSRSPLPRTVSL